MHSSLGLIAVLLQLLSSVFTPQPSPLMPRAIPAAPPSAVVSAPAASSTKEFEGSWFTISYPASFTAEAGMKSLSDASGVDSAWFKSPDGRVEFYVFSPQWNGVPDLQPPAGTKVAEEKSGSVVVRRATWVEDGAMTISLVDSEDTEYNTRYTFGIAYISQAEYEKWKPAYLAFKQSLQQYAD